MEREVDWRRKHTPAHENRDFPCHILFEMQTLSPIVKRRQPFSLLALSVAHFLRASNRNRLHWKTSCSLVMSSHSLCTEPYYVCVCVSLLLLLLLLYSHFVDTRIATKISEKKQHKKQTIAYSYYWIKWIKPTERVENWTSDEGRGGGGSGTNEWNETNTKTEAIWMK